MAFLPVLVCFDIVQFTLILKALKEIQFLFVLIYFDMFLFRVRLRYDLKN